MAKMSSVMKVHKTWGQRKEAVLADDSFQGTATTSPSRKLFVSIHASTAGITDSVWVSVRLTFGVRFESPKMVALSATRHLTLCDRAKCDEKEGPDQGPTVEVGCSGNVEQTCTSGGCHCPCVARPKTLDDSCPGHVITGAIPSSPNGLKGVTPLYH